MEDKEDIQDNASFEENLGELEDIVRRLENGGLSLDDSLELFERGIALTRLCSSKLEHARLRIDKLVEENKIEEVKID